MKILKTITLLSLLFISSISTLFAQSTEKEEAAMKHNAENYKKIMEAEEEDAFCIFNSTNSEVTYTLIDFGYDRYAETLKPYKPLEENFEDIRCGYDMYGFADRKQYDPEFEFIEYKSSPSSKTNRIYIELGTCYVFYLSEDGLKLGTRN